MAKLLGLRAWWLQQVTRLTGGSDINPRQQIDALLKLCTTSTCPFSDGAAATIPARIPSEIVAPFRNAQAELERVRESLARLPLEVDRAGAYWTRFVELVQHGIALRESRIQVIAERARPWLPVLLLGDPDRKLEPAITAALSAFTAEVSALRGQVHMLGQTLQVGKAQVAIGKATQARVGEAAAVAAVVEGEGGAAGAPEADPEDEDDDGCGSDSESSDQDSDQ